MLSTTKTESNYVYYYNVIQMVLPLDVETIIPESSEVVSFLDVMKGINLNKYFEFKLETRGRNGYDKTHLLRTVLFAYMINVRSLREIARMCQYDIRFMHLMEGATPSFMAFERLEKDYLSKSYDDIFFDVSKRIGSLMNIDYTKSYTDGTKIEANANKNTFVYKKRITNQINNKSVDITNHINDLNIEFGYSYPIKELYNALDMGYIAQYLMEVMILNDITPVYGTGRRKTVIQRYYDYFLDVFIKFNDYEYWLDIIGNRNSCSKTDLDATMCATKMDYYNNTGITRPCYNAQISVSDGVIVNADLFQRPADNRTFIPMMERFYQYYGFYPLFPMADAGYGDYENYMYCINKMMNPVMKYSMYGKAEDSNFIKTRKYNSYIWSVNDAGYKICPNGSVFDEYKYTRIDYDRSGQDYLKLNDYYQNHGQCASCPLRKECIKSEINNRTITRNSILDEFYGYVDLTLSTEFGKELKKQRSIQVEGAFGVIKNDMKFTKFTRRGINNTKMEFLLVCLAYNLRKYHHYRLHTQEIELLN